MRPRLTGESQRAYVARVLRAEGRIATYDVLYGLEYDDGRKCSITRLAAIVCDLRAEGWEIATFEEDHGTTAIYRLVRSAGAWACTGCGAAPASDITPALGGYAQAYCLACRHRALFAWRKAA